VYRYKHLLIPRKSKGGGCGTKEGVLDLCPSCIGGCIGAAPGKFGGGVG